MYRSSLDLYAKVATTMFFVILVCLIYVFLKVIPDAAAIKIQKIAAGILLFIILLVSFAYRLTSYQVENRTLIIHRPFKKLSKKIAASDIREVKLLERSETRGLIRTFANGGLFGYWGKYYNREIGHVSVYANNWKHPVLITLADSKKILLGPDDTSLVSELQSMIN
jgi:hypothetical protein